MNMKIISHAGLNIDKYTVAFADSYLLLTGILKQWTQSLKVAWCGDNNLEVLWNSETRNINVYVVYECFPIKLYA